MGRKDAVGFASLLIAAAAPVHAVETTTLPAALPSSFDSSLQAAQSAAMNNDCTGVLAALDPIVPQLGQVPQRPIIQRMRLACLAATGRTGEIPAVQQELAKTLPKDGLVQAFGVLVAADSSHFVDAADKIVQLAGSSPKNLELLTGASVRAIAIQLGEQRAFDARGRMMVALAKADWLPADMPDLRVSVTQGAIDSLVDQGRADEAANLLERVDEPEQLTAMAIERRYSVLWPSIEDMLGTNGKPLVDRYAKSKLDLYSDNPDAPGALRDAAAAMLLLGRYDDVVQMTSDVVPHDGMDRDSVRTALIRARALLALKRTDDALKLMTGFAALNLAKTPEAAATLVTYAEMLDEAGREEQALTAARAINATAGQFLTDYGKRWVDRTEVCALGALGRTAEANAAMAKLLAAVQQNQPATIEALLCLKRDAEAEKLLIKAIDDKDVASNIVVQFQPAASQWAAAPSRLRLLWQAFLARPAVKAAFERKGRLLPKAMWPTPGARPVPRDKGTNLT